MILFTILILKTKNLVPPFLRVSVPLRETFPVCPA